MGSRGSAAEEALAFQLKVLKVQFRREVTGLVPGRRFRVDFFLPPSLVVEVEGITPGGGGRHQRPAGFTRDTEKYNGLAEQGYTVLRYTPKHIRDGSALAQIERVLTRILAGRRLAGASIDRIE